MVVMGIIGFPLHRNFAEYLPSCLIKSLRIFIFYIRYPVIRRRQRRKEYLIKIKVPARLQYRTDDTAGNKCKKFLIHQFPPISR